MDTAPGKGGSAGDGCADYANAMEAVAQKQGVYFIRACDPAVSGIDMQDEDFRAKYCLKHDDISHLNAAGMKIALSNFEKLIADEGGKYHELWNAQAQYYVEEKEA